MSQEQFQKSWTRESSSQPGIILDVITVSRQLFSTEQTA